MLWAGQGPKFSSPGCIPSWVGMLTHLNIATVQRGVHYSTQHIEGDKIKTQKEQELA
jgi:hypothetical protein